MPPGLWLMFCIIFCLSTPALLGAHVLLASRERSSQSFMELTEPTQKQGVISGPRLCLWKPSGSAICCTGVASVTPHTHRWYTGDFFSSSSTNVMFKVIFCHLCPLLIWSAVWGAVEKGMGRSQDLGSVYALQAPGDSREPQDPFCRMT